MAKQKSRGKKKVKKNIAVGVVHLCATFNNTIVTITDRVGNTISWSSAGSIGFKGSRKSTPFAAQMAGETAAKKAMDHGLKAVEVHVKGPGSGREGDGPPGCRHRICAIRRLSGRHRAGVQRCSFPRIPNHVEG